MKSGTVFLLLLVVVVAGAALYLGFRKDADSTERLSTPGALVQGAAPAVPAALEKPAGPSRKDASVTVAEIPGSTKDTSVDTSVADAGIMTGTELGASALTDLSTNPGDVEYGAKYAAMSKAELRATLDLFDQTIRRIGDGTEQDKGTVDQLPALKQEAEWLRHHLQP